jgi:hypothetical protein
VTVCQWASVILSEAKEPNPWPWTPSLRSG